MQICSPSLLTQPISYKLFEIEACQLQTRFTANSTLLINLAGLFDRLHDTTGGTIIVMHYHQSPKIDPPKAGRPARTFLSYNL